MERKEKIIQDHGGYLPPEVAFFDIMVEAGFAQSGIIPDPGDDDWT